jgi:hypothetical protein
MAALRADHLVELLLHERVQHAQSDTNAQRQQALLRGAGQLAERLLHTGGQHLLGGRLLGDRYVLLHGGSSFDLWSDHRARCHRQRTRRRDRRPTKFHELWDNLLENVDWSEFDFVDLGCSKGGSIRFCQGRFDADRGLGVDQNPAKVAETVAAGFDAAQSDATKLDQENVVRFVSMMDFLEHLPSLEAVEAAIDGAARAATDLLFISHPSFEGEGEFGVRQYWWNWTGHTAHIKVADYRGIFERLGLHDYTIRYIDPVYDSSHSSVLPLDTPKDQHQFDPAVHPVKPAVEFPNPLWRAQRILVALRRLERSEWERLIAAIER